MATQRDSVKLSTAHASYLEAILPGVGPPAGLTLSGQVLEGPRVAMEGLRDLLTEMLAERGFDEDYSTTAEGELIEGLIDALHRP